MNETIGYSKGKFLQTYEPVRKRQGLFLCGFVGIAVVETLLILADLTPISFANVMWDPILLLAWVILFFYIVYLQILIFGHRGCAERSMVRITDERIVYVKLISVWRYNSRDSRYEIQSVDHYYVKGFYIHVTGKIVERKYFTGQLISTKQVVKVKMYDTLSDTERVLHLLEELKQNKK